MFAATEAEVSKVPFYVAGSMTALWAVGASSLGIARREFPQSRRGMVLVIVLSCLFVAATIATAILTS